MHEDLEKEGGRGSVWKWLFAIFIALLILACAGGVAFVVGAWMTGG